MDTKMQRLLNHRGFSLIEVLIAMTILAVALLAVATMQTTAMDANSISRSHTTAVQLAEEMVERLRVNAGNSPIAYNGIDTSGVCTGFAEPVRGDCLQWQDRLGDSGLTNAIGTVGVVNNSPMSNTATATITIQWGGGRQVQMTTIVETWGT